MSVVSVILHWSFLAKGHLLLKIIMHACAHHAKISFESIELIFKIIILAKGIKNIHFSIIKKYLCTLIIA